MRDLATTLLDMVGLVLLAAGAGLGAAQLATPLGFVAAGVVVLAGSWFIDWQGEPASGDAE